MHNSEAPIGVFDSGFGGISALRQLTRVMSNEDYIYFGDSKNAPYGGRDVEEVGRLTMEAVDFLTKDCGVKAVVIACNTATSAAIGRVRARYPSMPVIGIEPALKPAIFETSRTSVLVMATELTLRERKFAALIERCRGGADIFLLPAPALVEFVERGELCSPALDACLNAMLAPYRDKGVGNVVLGCTHFPFVADSIKKATGSDVRIFDGLHGTALETKRRLEAAALRRTETRQGNVIFLNSNGTERAIALSRKLFYGG